VSQPEPPANLNAPRAPADPNQSLSDADHRQLIRHKARRLVQKTQESLTSLAEWKQANPHLLEDQDEEDEDLAEEKTDQ